MSRTREIRQTVGLPLGKYHVRISAVEDGIKSTFDDKMQVKLVNRVLDIISVDDEDDEEFAEEQVGSDEFSWANDTWNPKTKIVRWYQGILGRTFDFRDPELAVDLDEIVGKEAIMTKGINQSGNVAVMDYAPWKPKRSKNGRRKAAPPPEDDDDDFEDNESDDEPF